MPSASTLVGLKELAQLTARLQNGPRRLRDAAVTILTRNLQVALRRANEIVTAGGKYFNKVPGKIHVRTGQLRRALGYEVGGRFTGSDFAISGNLGTLKAPGGSIPIYWHVMHDGTDGPITPKTAEVLTVPLPKALTPSGVLRFTAGDLDRGETEYTHSFWAKSQKGNLILFGTTDKPVFGDGDRVSAQRSKPIPLFVGKKELPALEGVQYAQRPIDEVTPTIREEIAGWWAHALLEEQRSA